MFIVFSNLHKKGDSSIHVSGLAQICPTLTLGQAHFPLHTALLHPTLLQLDAKLKLGAKLKLKLQLGAKLKLKLGTKLKLVPN